MEMLAFVGRVYPDFLNDEERAFIQRLNALDMSARCLYIRMANRKTRFFALQHIAHYDEIDSPRDALAALLETSFVRRLHPEDALDVLASLPKSDLTTLADDLDLGERRTSWGKAKLVAFILASADRDELVHRLNLDQFVTPLQNEHIGYFLYLYFGRAQENLTSFALRDLGLIRVRNEKEHRPRFDNISEARQGFYYQRLLQRLKSGVSIEKEVQFIRGLVHAASDFIANLRDQALFKLGHLMERAGDMPAAIDIYSLSDGYICRERLCRLLHMDGQRGRLERLLQQIIESPGSDEEYLFASDFYERKFNKKKLGIYTELLRGSQSFAIDDIHRGQPEYGAIGYFEREGWQGFHAENYLWLTAFGLVFWEELFERIGAYSSDFDMLPQALRDGSFYNRYQSDIQGKLAEIRAGHAWGIAAESIKRAKKRPNGLFFWYDDTADMLKAFLQEAPSQALAIVLGKMAEKFSTMRDGFPDLLLVKGDQIRFVEIKAEGDHIRRNQLARLMFLREAGFAVDIYQVGYQIDPDQTYVVVDVETTGGRPPYDRVIEIGAVKVKQGQIIDEFQSLINPRRSIPQGITTLTGISNVMVRDAPGFEEVADQFLAFLEGSVFVAHNVSFDYGFISSEYARLERRFRFPKLCTVAQMRRHYPGHGSYSLGVISREYGIPLKNHHRALDDARAAAELLLLVNTKRAAGGAL
jgi:DNA polymerase-3 subunit epsilon